MSDKPTITTFDYSSLDAETRIVVQQRASEIKSLMHRTMQDILDIGRKFAEVRELLRHNKAGGFEGWIEAEGWKTRTVYNLIYIHESFANFAEIARLDMLVTVLFALAAPSTPKSAREEAVKLASEGQKLTVKDAKQIIASHKPQPPQPAEPPKDWMDTLIVGKHYPVDRKRGVVIDEPFDSDQDVRAAYPGLRPESTAYLRTNKTFFTMYRFVAPEPVTPPSLPAETPAPEGQALHVAGVDDSTSPDEPAAPRHDPRAVSNTGEWTPGEKAYMNRSQAALNHAHPGKSPYIGKPVEVDEVARLKARIAELEAENEALRLENTHLKVEIVVLRNKVQPSDGIGKPAERMHQ
jgi:hypothetical protein